MAAPAAVPAATNAAAPVMMILRTCMMASLSRRILARMVRLQPTVEQCAGMLFRPGVVPLPQVVLPCRPGDKW